MPRKPKGTIGSNTVLRSAFLSAYAKLGNITAASRAVGCDVSTHRAVWMKQPDYPPLFEAAKEQAVETLEAVALQRATTGPKPSDLLLIFLLKAAKPEKYRENVQHQHGGQVTLKMYAQEAPVDKV